MAADSAPAAARGPDGRTGSPGRLHRRRGPAPTWNCREHVGRYREHVVAVPRAFRPGLATSGDRSATNGHCRTRGSPEPSQSSDRWGAGGILLGGRESARWAAAASQRGGRGGRGCTGARRRGSTRWPRGRRNRRHRGRRGGERCRADRHRVGATRRRGSPEGPVSAGAAQPGRGRSCGAARSAGGGARSGGRGRGRPTISGRSQRAGRRGAPGPAGSGA